MSSALLIRSGGRVSVGNFTSLGCQPAAHYVSEIQSLFSVRLRQILKSAMFLTSFCLSIFLSSCHGFGHDEQFITQVLNLQDSDDCVLGLVSDGERSAISAEFIANLDDRW